MSKILDQFRPIVAIINERDARVAAIDREAEEKIAMLGAFPHTTITTVAVMMPHPAQPVQLEDFPALQGIELPEISGDVDASEPTNSEDLTPETPPVPPKTEEKAYRNQAKKCPGCGGVCYGDMCRSCRGKEGGYARAGRAGAEVTHKDSKGKGPCLTTPHPCPDCGQRCTGQRCRSCAKKAGTYGGATTKPSPKVELPPETTAPMPSVPALAIQRVKSLTSGQVSNDLLVARSRGFNTPLAREQGWFFVVYKPANEADPSSYASIEPWINPNTTGFDVLEMLQMRGRDWFIVDSVFTFNPENAVGRSQG